jgi:hypothetical protein
MVTNTELPAERAAELAVPIIAHQEVEGTGDNPRSTAAGYGQFIDSTFIAVYKKTFPQEAQGLTDKQILAKRGTGVEPPMMLRHTQDNVDLLVKNGLRLTPQNIYAMHHMGEGGGVGLLRARPDQPAEQVLGSDTIAANPQFAGKTVAQVKDWLAEHAAKGVPLAKREGGIVRDAAGPVVQGNIDLHNRPVVKNPDGSISTVRSITVGFGDKTYVLPTVVGGKVVGDEEAIAHFRKTGEHLGAFKRLEDAEAYSQRLHQEQAAEYAPQN